MAWTLANSGTTAALSIGSETTLATNTSNGTFVAQVDTSNLVLGDALTIRLYTINLSGGSLTQTWEASYANVQSNNMKVTPFIASDQSFRVTLTQTTGTGRTFAWKILSQ